MILRPDHGSFSAESRQGNDFIRIIVGVFIFFFSREVEEKKTKKDETLLKMAGCNNSTTPEEESDPRRKILRMVVCSLCYDAGFSAVQNTAAETLTEMLQSILGEIGRSAQAYCELAGRTIPMLSDVSIALIEMGTNIEQVPVYAKKPNKNVFIPPIPKRVPPVPGILETGERKQHPSYIPDHYPSFPGPHSYIRTPTHRDPINDYQLVREKAATQKRDTERALTRFIAKTGKTQKLFNDDNGIFPLIAVKPITMAYLNALLPKDQDLDAQLPVENQWANIMQKYSEEHVSPEGATTAAAAATSGNASATTAAAGTSNLPGGPLIGDPAYGMDKYDFTQVSVDSTGDSEVIDNPYLRAVKPPRKKKR